MTGPPPFAVPGDVADVWRPLTPDEEDRAFNLIDKASALLRQRMPWVDARIATYLVDPTIPAGLAPITFATVVATVVKRFLQNTGGIVSEGIGQTSVMYAMRGEVAVRGELDFLKEDLLKLAVPSLSPARLGTITVKPRLAPWPYGALTSAQDATDALDVFYPDGSTDGNWWDAEGGG